MERVFSLSSLLVIPLWSAMVLLPTWRLTQRVLGSPWSVAPAAALYAALVFPLIPEVWPDLAHPTLPGIMALLGSPAGATIGWVHFLAFDLFVGRWAYLDSRERGVSPWLMAPVLLLTLLFGPLGLLLYLGVRAGERWRRGATWVGVAAEARRALTVNRPLSLVVMASVPLVLVTLVGVVVDPRTVVGAPIWLKPFKFAVSTGIYSLTLLWMLSRVSGRARLVRTVATVTAVAFVVEWGIIGLQAYRGTASHFNVGTPLDGALFGVMGIFVILLWIMNLLAAWLLLRQEAGDRAFSWSLRLGLISALLGGIVAIPMLGPTPEQRAELVAGAPPTVVGAHTVGVPDGGPGLPLTGWSTRGGDLRVAHFVGLHGLQLLPLFGWWVSRRRRFEAGHRMTLVWTGGLAYLGLILLLCVQALRGEPLTAPSFSTLATAGMLAALALVAAVGVLLQAHRARRRPVLPGLAGATEGSGRAPHPATPVHTH